MLTPDESAALRNLQEKAYRPGGSLSSEDAARLAELTARRASAVRESAASPSDASRAYPVEPEITAVAERTAEDEAQQEHDDADVSIGASADAGAEPQPALGRARWWRLPVVAAVAAACGLGIGWMIFDDALADGIRDLALSDERATIEEQEGPFVPGSLVFQGEQDGVTVWTAERAEPQLECIVMLVADSSAAYCPSAEEIDAFGDVLSASLMFDGEDGQTVEAYATVARDASGERVAIIRVQDQQQYEYNWEDQFSEEEVARARLIATATDINPETLSIVGYDDGEPVWYGYRGTGTCLVAPQGDSFAWNCVTDVGVDAVAVDGTSADGQPVQYSVDLTGSGAPVLTIDWRSGAASDAE